jgi:hypothetical protein
MAPMRVHSWRSKLSMNRSAEHRLGSLGNRLKTAEAALGAPTEKRFRG